VELFHFSTALKVSYLIQIPKAIRLKVNRCRALSSPPPPGARAVCVCTRPPRDLAGVFDLKTEIILRRAHGVNETPAGKGAMWAARYAADLLKERSGAAPPPRNQDSPSASACSLGRSLDRASGSSPSWRNRPSVAIPEMDNVDDSRYSRRRGVRAPRSRSSCNGRRVDRPQKFELRLLKHFPLHFVIAPMHQGRGLAHGG
jgi:hypothetical protein